MRRIAVEKWRKEGGDGSDKVHALFVCHKKSTVIRYLNPNQQFHIRNPSRIFFHLITVLLSFCTNLGDTRFVLCDRNRWAFIVKPRLYANVNLDSPDPEAWPDRVYAFYTTRFSLAKQGVGWGSADKKWLSDSTSVRSSLSSVFSQDQDGNTVI